MLSTIEPGSDLCRVEADQPPDLQISLLISRACSVKAVRALGATPEQLIAGLSAAQLLSALPGALAGIPLGIELFAATSRSGPVTIPSTLSLLAVFVTTVLVLVALAIVPGRIGARQPVAEVLRSEYA